MNAPLDDDDIPMMVSLDCNIRKNTVKLEPENGNPDLHVVSFDFDATVDGRFSITFCAEEDEDNGTIVPQAPNLFPPTEVDFNTGMGQTFTQAPGTDLSLWAENELNLLVSAERDGEALGQKQILHYAVEKIDGVFCVKLMKEILWESNFRYQICGIYGEDEPEGEDEEEEGCTICLSSPRNALVLPCRHLCMCMSCSRAVMATSKCPICRDPISSIVDLTDFP